MTVRVVVWWSLSFFRFYVCSVGGSVAEIFLAPNFVRERMESNPNDVLNI